MNRLNDFSNVETIFKRLIPSNAQEIVRDYDMVIDGSDNAKTRYLVNDACVLEKVSKVQFLTSNNLEIESSD
jgi:SAMP-activating enzyme